jgi:hypothetical protein
MKRVRHEWMWVVLAAMLIGGAALAQQRPQWPPPPAHEVFERQAEEAATGETPSIPNRFLTRSRGYEQALELQKATGADIFLYIKHNSPPSARGLCNWWENRGMKAGNIQRLLRDYIKVELPLPSDRETREIADQFRLWEGPTVVVIQAGGLRRSISVFDWPGGRPELKSPDELEKLIRENSSARYHEERR